jgi:TatD DNase family protein
VIDSHCHIAGQEFAEDLDEVVARARAAGLSAALVMLATGDEKEAAAGSRLRTVWPEVRFATGIHPHQAGEFAADQGAAIDLVRRCVVERQACAIGEIGLDYHYDFSPRPDQQDLFRLQTALARELQLPVVIHTREATPDTFEVLRNEGSGVRGVFHCFTGNAAMARQALDIGFYVSFSGIITFPRSGEIREAARIVPADRLLAETDSPYLAPVPHRGKRNEPAHVVRVVEALAELRGEARSAVEARIDANFDELFGSPSNPRHQRHDPRKSA